MPDPGDPHPDRGSWRYELPATPPQREVRAAQLWLAGASGVLESADGLTAWFPATSSSSVPAVDPPPGGVWAYEPDRDWQAEWKATIEPVRAGRFLVVPSWMVQTADPRPDDTVLVLDPGRAFGSGHHATTSLCLEILDELDLAGRPVADVGCGTGVLAIAAAKRGAQVVAVDIDPDAVQITAQNAADNDVHLTTMVGSVDALDGPVDVLIANLVTDVIVQLAGALVAAAQGTLVVSGIATARLERARAALEAAGAVVEDVRHRDGWVAIRLRSGHRTADSPSPAPTMP